VLPSVRLVSSTPAALAHHLCHGARPVPLDATNFYGLHGKGRGSFGRSFREEQAIAYRVLLGPGTVTPTGSSLWAGERRATAVDGLTTAVVRASTGVASGLIFPHARTAQRDRLGSREQRAKSCCLHAHEAWLPYMLRRNCMDVLLWKAQVSCSVLLLNAHDSAQSLRIDCAADSQRLVWRASARPLPCGSTTKSLEKHLQLHELHALHRARSLKLLVL